MLLEVTYISEANKQQQRGRELGEREKRMTSEWLQIQLLSSDLLVTEVSINLIFKWLLIQCNILKAYLMGYTVLFYSLTMHMFIEHVCGGVYEIYTYTYTHIFTYIWCEISIVTHIYISLYVYIMYIYVCIYIYVYNYWAWLRI